MRKSAKLSLALALMMGTTAGVNMVAPSSASAEISDKFRMEINGVMSFYHDADKVGYTYTDSNGKHKDNYWNNYTRLQLEYYVDKDTKLHARLHSNYDDVGDFMANTNTSGAYFDQSYLEVKDRKANTTYTLGKFGGVMGQTMVYNSTSSFTGAKIQLGNWWDPNNVCFYYGDRKNGDRVKAVDAKVGVAKNVGLSVSYLDVAHSTATAEKYYYYGKAVQQADGRYVTNKRDTDFYEKNLNTYKKNHLLAFGGKAKMPGVTLVTEYSHQLNGKIGTNNSRKGWFVEAFVGPTSDMTSGLPLQKPGTNVYSVKYQDIGVNSVIAHNPTFFDDMKGVRLNYGHTFKKGLSADIAVGRFKDKGGAYGDKGVMKNIVIGEVAYKFR